MVVLELEHYVLEFQIPMKNLLPMEKAHSLRDFREDRSGLGLRQSLERVPLQIGGEILSFRELKHQMGELTTLDSVFDSDDMRMTDRGENLELVLDHALSLVLSDFEVVEAFDCHRFSSESVECLVDTGEGAFSEMLRELIEFVELEVFDSDWNDFPLLEELIGACIEKVQLLLGERRRLLLTWKNMLLSKKRAARLGRLPVILRLRQLFCIFIVSISL